MMDMSISGKTGKRPSNGITASGGHTPFQLTGKRSHLIVPTPNLKHPWAIQTICTDCFSPAPLLYGLFGYHFFVCLGREITYNISNERYLDDIYMFKLCSAAYTYAMAQGPTLRTKHAAHTTFETKLPDK